MELKEVYEKIGGDYDDVVRRLMGEKLVRKFLLKFLDDKSYADLERTLSEGDYCFFLLLLFLLLLFFLMRNTVAINVMINITKRMLSPRITFPFVVPSDRCFPDLVFFLLLSCPLDLQR